MSRLGQSLWHGRYWEARVFCLSDGLSVLPQADLQLAVPFPQLPREWDSRCVSPCLDKAGVWKSAVLL